MDETVKQILNQFGIEDKLPVEEAPTRRVKSYRVWMIGGRYILKSYTSDVEKVKKIAEINRLLFQQGALVANFHKTKTRDLCAYADELYFTLSDKLPGTHFKPTSKKRVYSLGKNLAKLHLALKQLDGKVEVYEMDTMGELHGWILNEINQKQIPVRKEVIDYCMEFGDLYRRLPRQIIHRDPHNWNILMDKDEVTGFIDFDITQINIRLLDIYYAFGPTQDNFEQWLEMHPYFLSGYHEISAISRDELSGYTYMCVLFALLWLAYVSINMKDKVESALKELYWTYDVRDKIAALNDASI